MPNQYPSLKPNEVKACLRALGFHQVKHSGGDHDYFEKNGQIVQIDTGKSVKQGFATPGMKIIINNSGYSREIFYRATKNSAKKIGMKPLTKKELEKIDS